MSEANIYYWFYPRMEFFLRGRPLLHAPYAYTESGLNVWLLNGFFRHHTPQGTMISIEDINGLQTAIYHSIICKRVINYREFKYIRTIFKDRRRTSGRWVVKDDVARHG